jgi:hypothetical protein
MPFDLNFHPLFAELNRKTPDLSVLTGSTNDQ